MSNNHKKNKQSYRAKMHEKGLELYGYDGVGDGVELERKVATYGKDRSTGGKGGARRDPGPIRAPMTSHNTRAEHGVSVSPQEFRALKIIFNEFPTVSFITEKMYNLVAFYQVRYSPGRKAMLGDLRRAYPVYSSAQTQGSDPMNAVLALHPAKFVRDLCKWYVTPPTVWNTIARQNYTLQVRDYVVVPSGRLTGLPTRAKGGRAGAELVDRLLFPDGPRLPSQYFMSASERRIWAGRKVKAFVVKKFRKRTQLNGTHGEATNTDDVKEIEVEVKDCYDCTLGRTCRSKHYHRKAKRGEGKVKGDNAKAALERKNRDKIKLVECEACMGTCSRSCSQPDHVHTLVQGALSPDGHFCRSCNAAGCRKAESCDSESDVESSSDLEEDCGGYDGGLDVQEERVTPTPPVTRVKAPKALTKEQEDIEELFGWVNGAVQVPPRVVMGGGGPSQKDSETVKKMVDRPPTPAPRAPVARRQGSTCVQGFDGFRGISIPEPSAPSTTVCNEEIFDRFGQRSERVAVANSEQVEQALESPSTINIVTPPTPGVTIRLPSVNWLPHQDMPVRNRYSALALPESDEDAEEAVEESRRKCAEIVGDTGRALTRTVDADPDDGFVLAMGKKAINKIKVASRPLLRELQGTYRLTFADNVINFDGQLPSLERHGPLFAEIDMRTASAIIYSRTPGVTEGSWYTKMKQRLADTLFREELPVERLIQKGFTQNEYVFNIFGHTLFRLGFTKVYNYLHEAGYRYYCKAKIYLDLYFALLDGLDAHQLVESKTYDIAKHTRQVIVAKAKEQTTLGGRYSLTHLQLGRATINHPARGDQPARTEVVLIDQQIVENTYHAVVNFLVARACRWGTMHSR